MKKNRKILFCILCIYIVMLASMLFLMLPPVVEILRSSLIYEMGIETTIAMVIGVVFCLTIMIFILYSMYSKNGDKEDQRISRMDDRRSYLEKQIYELNKKLVLTEEQWRETYQLVMSSQDKQSNRTGEISTNSFLKGFGINLNDIEIQKDLAFILMPFHNDFSETYYAVNDVCQTLKLTLRRGDEEHIASDILKNSINYITKARLIIAVLDGRNPNVFYELGIAHSLNKPTILIANAQTDVPFDLKNQFIVLYENESDLKKKLSSALLNVLTSN